MDESVHKKPVNLNFLSIRFPITAYVSIAHRVSGLLLFFLIPLLLGLLEKSLSSKQSFELLQSYFNLVWAKLLIWLSLSAYFYHFFAGIRHLLMDMHIGESKKGGKRGAFIVIGLTILFVLSLGAYLWL
ncbi:MAG: succinate dehydrogenase [Francisellaceae bacterium]|nr:succinate dehydrogenase [Francisellaceae bacterium]